MASLVVQNFFHTVQEELQSRTNARQLDYFIFAGIRLIILNSWSYFIDSWVANRPSTEVFSVFLPGPVWTQLQTGHETGGCQPAVTWEYPRGNCRQGQRAIYLAQPRRWDVTLRECFVPSCHVCEMHHSSLTLKCGALTCLRLIWNSFYLFISVNPAWLLWRWQSHIN